MRDKCHNACLRAGGKRKGRAGVEEHTVVGSLVIGEVEIQHQVILIQLGRAEVI